VLGAHGLEGRVTIDPSKRVGNFFYNLVWTLGYPAFWTSSRPVVLHRERARLPGGYILAANHTSPYDVPCLMATHPRVMDFVSITEIMSKPLLGWFFRNMGTFALDRSRRDPQAVRVILDRLAQGHVVTMFPEGRIPTREQSVLHGGSIRRGIGRIAQLASAPVLPCVILGTGAYQKFTSWLPLQRTIYAVNFGEPIPPTDANEDPAGELLEKRLTEAYYALHAELLDEVERRGLSNRLSREFWSNRLEQRRS
jgi:1-acyl-sn-glycerol-3-phosphate acyltransferase